MSRVENEPEALDAFRHQLIAFDRLLSDEYRKIVGEWAGLSDVWNDQQYQECGSSLQEVGRGIEAYLGAAEGHEDYLQKLVTELLAVQAIRIRR